MSKKDAQQTASQRKGVFQELASADVKLVSLLVDGGEYLRTSRRFLRNASGWFRCVPEDGEFVPRRAVAFMLQGILVAFVVFTFAHVIPSSIAQFVATQYATAVESSESVTRLIARVEHVKRALPGDLREAWLSRSELLLVLKVLPEDRYQALIARITTLSTNNPDQLRMAIVAPQSPGVLSSGRAYVAGFFLSLNDFVGPMLLGVTQITGAGAKHEFRPYVAWFLQSLVSWYFACLAITWGLKSEGVTQSKHVVFWMGAYVVGFFSPFFEVLRLFLQLYLSATLASYVNEASILMFSTMKTNIADVTGGVFPFENLILGCVRIGVAIVFFLLAARAMSINMQSHFAVGSGKAWTTAAIGIGFGLAVAEGVTALLRIVLVPTGLI